MISYSKNIFRYILTAAVLMIPIFAYGAQGQDYLYVSGTYDGTHYSIDSVEQRVFQASDAHQYQSGTYEARLYRGTTMISHNFFEIGQPGTVEAVGTNKLYGTGRIQSQIFAVAVPLLASLDIASAKIQILKSGQLLVEKGLGQVPVTVLSAQVNKLQTTEDLTTGSSYLFYLYYDHGQLFADRDYPIKYDVLPEAFVREVINTPFPFKGEVINLKGEVKETFQFDPKKGNPNFIKGKTQVKAPYLPDGQKVNFYDAQGKPLLSVFVSDSSFCNDNGVCDSARGEDANACPNDCAGITQAPQPSPMGTEAGGGLNPMVIAGLLIALGVAGGWYGWRLWKKKKESNIMSP